VTEIPAETVQIRAVAAGKNHCIALEEWESDSSASGFKSNRTFSWGNGAHGKLGHNCADDEMVPREITTLTDTRGPQKSVRVIACGAGHSLAITHNRAFYFWGKMSNSPRGEATVYPKLEQDLVGCTVRCVAGGSNSIVVGFESTCAAWGVLPAGKFGLQGDVKSSTTPKYVSPLDNLTTLSVSCGYGHVCYLVTEEPELYPVLTESWKMAQQSSGPQVKGRDPKSFPVYPYAVGGTSDEGGKKRAAGAEEGGGSKGKKTKK